MENEYEIESQWNGAFYTIVRISDMASVFLQGDDALQFESDLDSCQTDKQIDLLCSQYDDVME